LGWGWLIIPPAAMIMIYSLVFSRLMRGSGLPDYGPMTYTLFLCSGLIAWQWFSELLTRTTGLFTNYSHLLKRTGVPWQALLASDVLVAFFGFLMIVLAFVVFLLVAGHAPKQNPWVIGPLLILIAFFAVALGLCLSVLQVFFRDIGLALPVVLQFWFWATPIVYPVSALPAELKGLVPMNLIAAPVQGLQQVFIPQFEGPSTGALLALALAALLLFWAGKRMIARNWDAMRDEF
jgi:lipopolysaccharide transport system permease protein